MNDPGLTLTYFTARSNLVPFVFIGQMLNSAVDFQDSTAILPLLLIQEEQLSVTGKRMCTKNW